MKRRPEPKRISARDRIVPEVPETAPRTVAMPVDEPLPEDIRKMLEAAYT